MAHQYVTLKETAAILGVSESEVNGLREQGDLRGFADRGTWKFRKDAVEDYARFRSLGSDPDVKVLDAAGPNATDLFRTRDMSEPNVLDHMGDDDSGVDDKAQQPSGRDSSGRLKLGDAESGIFSDGADDSGINLVPEDEGVTVGGTDSGLAIDLEGESGLLVGGSSPTLDLPADFDEAGGDDPDLDKTVTFDAAAATDDEDDTFERTAQLEAESGFALDGDDAASDVDLTGGESGIALDLAEGSGLVLGDGGEESGIALDLAGGVDDSGIALDFDDDSGLALDAGDSGIALDAGDSGISLDFATDSDFASPAGSQRAAVPAQEEMTVNFEDLDEDDAAATRSAPATADSEFDLGASEQSLEFDAASEGLGELADDDEFEDDFDDDVDGELDEFEDDFGEEGGGAYAGDQFEEDDARPAGARRSRQANWGTATFAGLVLCSLVIGVTGLVTWQSMRQMWSGQAEESMLDPIVDTIVNAIPF